MRTKSSNSPQKNDNIIQKDIFRLAILGGVDVGKSTLCGVMTQGMLDDGQGKTRLNLFR